ncbi:MAG: nucleotidyltransferase family protein [Geitlerinemataceae cyanobacterium]
MPDRSDPATETAIALPHGISVDRQQLVDLCDRWKITELQLFGSILRDDFRPDSDIDLLVTWHDSHRWSLFDFVDMHDDFAALFQRRVDLVSKEAIETSDNYLRRAAILDGAQPFYPQP